jgi:hypothetical protein
MATCRGRGCGAEVVFVPSAKSGRPMVLDAKPAKGVVIYPDPIEAVGPGPTFTGGGFEGRRVAAVVDVYTDHHATCPDAGAFR